jgi:signal transduction histidine kinase
MRDGDLQNMLLIFEDVTQLELTRKELIQAKESAEQSDRLKTSFLQNLSHEVRTPLNGIMGFAELLNEGQNSENEILVFSQQILKNGYRLIEMIENLIDISQIETNQISYEHSSFKLKDLFSEIYEEYRGIAQEKNLEFMLNTSAITETHLMGSDRKKLYKVFRILLSNAFKFTDTGHIIFGCRYSNEFFEIYVKDTGIGIPSEMQHQVFKRFEQTENYESRKHGGNGIGLSICQEFTRLMRAKIILESETGIGSVFTIRFPKSVISELASI